MHQQRIYRRNTIGENTRVFIAKGIEYTTAATFEDFADNGLDGEVGVFKITSAMKADVEATLQAIALVAGEKFFLAQVQVQADGERLVKKTPVATFEDISDKRREAFCLPVLQVTDMGWNGVDGDIADVVPAVIVGDIFSVSIVETTEGYQPFPTWNYEYQAIAGDTIVEVVAGLVAQINNISALQHKENPPVVSAAVNSNGTGAGGALNEAGIKITALETQLTFKVTVKEKLRDTLVRVTTDMKYGSGFREDVSLIEREGQIFDGTTTVNAAYRDEHGRQVDYANSTLAYDYFHLDLLKRFESKGYKNSEDTQFSQVLIAAPMDAAPGGDYVAATFSPIGELATIFGL